MDSMTIKARNPRRWWALAAITLSVLAAGIDQTVLSVALPTLARALAATTEQLQWFVAAFSLALCAMLLPAGLLGDRFGRKRMLMAALVVFGAGSALCAYSTTPALFILARIILGIGAAFLTTLAISVLPVIFDDEERPRAVGIWAAANFLALPIGPILGGWMLTRLWWGSVFLINVPVVLLSILAVALLVPESRSQKRPSMDPLGILLSSVGLSGLIYGVIAAGQYGWGTVRALAPLAAGALVTAGFVGWEVARSRRPGSPTLIELSLFRSARYTWGTILNALAAFAMAGLLFTLPQYSQAILGADAMGAGIRLLPIIGGLLVGAMSANRLTGRLGARATTSVGFALMAAAFLAATGTTISTGFGYTAAWVAVAGAGLGFAFASSAAGAIGDLPAERSGVGSAAMQAVQKVGVPFGAAVLGAVFNAGYRGHLALAGLPDTVAHAVRQSVYAGVAAARQLSSAELLESVRKAFVVGMDGMFWISAGLMSACVVISLAVLPSRQRGTAARLPEETANG